MFLEEIKMKRIFYNDQPEFADWYVEYYNVK
jgi:hypothetical protein